MNVLRIYLPSECDSAGVPLDWERCRSCDGAIRPESSSGPLGVSCRTCAGHGSLKAAALGSAYLLPTSETLGTPIRCEDCGHPMSKGTWEGEYGDEISHADVLAGDEPLRRHLERNGTVHYSPCDTGCRHRPWPGRHRTVAGGWETDGILLGLAAPSCREASWRPVDVRCLSWPHDLRPEQLAVLCLRCWAARDNPGEPA